MEVPSTCPCCKIRKWQSKEYEISETYVEYIEKENGVMIKKGTLVRQFKCSLCGYVIKYFQDPHQNNTDFKNNDYSCSGSPGSSYSRAGKGAHTHVTV
jgi:rubredoxin